MPNESILITTSKSFTSRKMDWVNSVVADPRIKHLHCRVAVALSFYLNARSSDCYVGQETLAKRVGCKERAVRNAITALIEAGYLDVQVNAGPNGTNIYRMIDIVGGDRTSLAPEEVATPAPPCLPDQDDMAPPRHRRAATPGTAVPPPPAPPCRQTPVLEHLCKNTCAEESILIIDNSRGAEIVPMIIEIDEVKSQTNFDQFWEIYPRKVAKAGAEKAYAKIIKSKQATASELIAGAARYAQERKGQDPKFTKHAATWLNQGCWEDEQLIQQPQRGPMTKANSMIAGMLTNLQERGVL